MAITKTPEFMDELKKPERWGAASKTSVTVVTLALSDLSDIRANIGGKQYVGLSALTCTISVSGVGGLDTGTIAASSTYFLHLVVSGGNLAIVASLSESLPTGFTISRLAGSFITNGSAQVSSAASLILEFLSSYV